MSWPGVPIGEICELVNGRAFKPTDWTADGLPIVRIQNLNDESANFNRFNGEVRERFLIDSGELLFSWSGTPGTSFGAFFWHRGPAVLNQHIFRVLVRDNLNANYMRYALNARIDTIIAQAHGGVGLQHITKDKLEATTIPLPPLPEQRRIADILDKADAIRRKRKEAITLTENLLRSAFLEMFGDPVTNPKGWPECHVEDLCANIVDCPHTTPEYSPISTPYPCVRTSELQNGYIDWSSTKYVDEEQYIARVERLVPKGGDIVYSREGARFGMAALIPPDTTPCLGQRMMLFRVEPQKAVPAFLWALLSSRAVFLQANAEVGGSASPHINVKAIKRFNAIVPAMKVQREFGAVCDRARAMRVRAIAHLENADSLFSSLVHSAFRGELTSSSTPKRKQLGLFGDVA